MSIEENKARVAPTSKQLTWNVLLMDTIVDGKIVLHYANADWIGVLVKLGVVPPPPSPPQPSN
jgi:predicted ester cyclase